MEHTELKNKAVRGIFALMSRSLFLQVANFVVLNVLAALLGRTNLGIFIAVSAVRDIFNLFIDVGLGAALVQKVEDITHEDLATTFVIQEILVAIVIVVGFLLSPYVGHALSLDASGIFLYQILLVTLLINSFKVIPSILLERKLEFEKQILPQLIENIVFDVIVVFLAWKNFGLSSYSYSIILSSIIGLIAYYLVSPWKPSLRISFPGARKLISFGLQYQGKGYLSVIKDQLLTLYLARSLGFADLGALGFAQRWAYSPYRFIVDSVTKVTFPAYARLQTHQQGLKTGIEKSLFGVSILLFPALVGIALGARLIVHIIPRLFQYQSSLPTLYIFCVQAAVSALSNVLINVLDATGRVKVTLGLMVFWIILTWGLTIVAVSRFGLIGVSSAQLLVSLTIVLTIYITKKVVNFNFLQNIYKPTIATLVMVVVSFLVANALPTNFLSMVSVLGLAGIIYVLVIYLLAKKEIVENLGHLKQIYSK